MKKTNQGEEVENTFCIGKNTGFWIANQSNMVVVGNFSEEEVRTGKIHNCLIAQNGKVIIKKDIIDFLGIVIPETEGGINEKN